MTADDLDLQTPADAAVVLQTVIRPSVVRAIQSVYAQQGLKRIHLLVGVDVAISGRQVLMDILIKAPDHVLVTVFDPEYSTSVRHGGVHSNHFGGSLRTLLTFAANSRYVAYLDDDDWYAPDHLASLREAIGAGPNRAWAFTRRWFVNPYNLEPMCVDTTENVGPNAGLYAQQGGFAYACSLMLDKIACAPLLHLWSQAGRPEGDAEDRMVFAALCRHLGQRYGDTGKPTVYHIIKPEDGVHPYREKSIAAAGYPLEKLRGGKHDYGRI